MKNRSSQLLVIGLLLVAFGAVLKIFKMELYSNSLLTLGLFLEISAGIIFFYDYVSAKK